MLPAAHRLTTTDLKATLKSGRRQGGSAVVLVARCTGQDLPPQFGVIAGKRVGNAPRRNLIRRRLREICRLNLATQLPSGTQLVVRALPNAAQSDYAELAAEVKRLARRLGQPRKREVQDGN